MPRFTGTLQLHVRNQGVTPAPPSEGIIFEDRDGDSRLSAGDPIHAIVALPAIAPCERLLLDVTLDVAVAFRSSPLRVALDSAGVVAELDETNNLASTNEFCHEVGPIDWTPIEKWRYYPPTPCEKVNGSTPIAASSPFVAQTTDDNADGRIDQDDNPDIVFLEQQSPLSSLHYIRILDGRTRTLINSIDPATVGTRIYDVAPAVADLDGDGSPEIVVQGIDATGLSATFAFHLDGSLAWLTHSQRGASGAWIVLADLESDGTIEVLTLITTFDSTGRIRWTSPLSFRAADGQVVVADVDVDGSKEVLAGGAGYRADGSFLWQHRDPLLPGFVAPALPTADLMGIARASTGAVPVVYQTVETGSATGAELYLMDAASGVPNWGPLTLPFARPAGRLAIGDLDGDGRAELVTSANRTVGATIVADLVAVNLEGTLLWHRTIPDWTASTTTLFDFNGDGRQEVVVRADSEVQILDGRTGLALATAPSNHLTLGEDAWVADVDKDGRADLLVPVGDSRFGRFQCGMIAYSNPTWWGARSTRPDSDYHVNDADDDGCVPAQEALSWCDHDTWRAQKAIPPPLADVTVLRTGAALATCPAPVLEARVGSAGMSAVPAGALVTFYDGDPGAGGTPLGSAATSRDLLPGTFEDVSTTVTRPAGVAALYAEVATSARECDIDNLCGPTVIPACGTACAAVAMAAPDAHCAGSPATLDGTGWSASVCSSPAELRFRQGAIVLRDWAPDLTFNWILPSPGTFEVDVRCPSDRSCTATAVSTSPFCLIRFRPIRERPPSRAPRRRRPSRVRRRPGERVATVPRRGQDHAGNDATPARCRRAELRRSRRGRAAPFPLLLPAPRVVTVLAYGRALSRPRSLLGHASPHHRHRVFVT